MRETLAEKIAWRRRSVRRPYVGMLRAGDEGIRLSGRDPVSGVEVALSIPLAEVENVRVAGAGDELLAGERCVVLELAELGGDLPPRGRSGTAPRPRARPEARRADPRAAARIRRSR